MARLVFVRMPGHTPLCSAVVYHCPPRSSLASKTVTAKPAWIACLAVASPPGPAPIIATRAELGSCMGDTVDPDRACQGRSRVRLPRKVGLIGRLRSAQSSSTDDAQSAGTFDDDSH